MKETRKQKKEKKKRNKNIKLGLKETIRPSRGSSPQPRKEKPESVSSLSLAR
jgi:hypothetical protein